MKQLPFPFGELRHETRTIDDEDFLVFRLVPLRNPDGVYSSELEDTLKECCIVPETIDKCIYGIHSNFLVPSTGVKSALETIEEFYKLYEEKYGRRPDIMFEPVMTC